MRSYPFHVHLCARCGIFFACTMDDATQVTWGRCRSCSTVAFNQYLAQRDAESRA